MAKYINPRVIRASMQELEAYKSENPNDKTPLFNVAAKFNDETRAAYVRAAQRLKWNVTRTKGHVYENGFYIW